MPLRPFRAALAALTLAVTLGATTTLALPRVGDVAPNIRVKDADDRPLEMQKLRGKPTLLIYEDKQSAEQNHAFKEELLAVRSDPRYTRAFHFAAVADVSPYKGWPIEGVARGVLRKRARAAGTQIYCDWDGSFRAAYRLVRHQSNVVLLDKDGRVLFASAGPLRPEDRARLLALVAQELR
jgi:hypothetical protein